MFPGTAFGLVGLAGLLTGLLGLWACAGLRQELTACCSRVQEPGAAARADGGAASSVDDSDGHGSQEESQAVLRGNTASAGAAASAAGAARAGQDQKTPAKQGDWIASTLNAAPGARVLPPWLRLGSLRV